jgi:hypothetical protein
VQKHKTQVRAERERREERGERTEERGERREERGEGREEREGGKAKSGKAQESGLYGGT